MDAIPTAADYEIDPAALQLITLDLERLAQEGVLIRVEVKGISQFRRRASWEMFGVAAADVRRANITQGMIACWPVQQVKKLESLEEQIRGHLLTYSHGIDHFAPWRFVRRGRGSRTAPEESPFWTWRLDFEQLQEALANLVMEMTRPDVYAAARAQYTEQMLIMAAEAWPAMERRLQFLQATAIDVAHPIVIPNGDEWIRMQVDNALLAFPSPDHIRSSVSARALYQQIANPLTLLAQQQAQAEARAAARHADIRADVEREAIEQEVLNSMVIQLLELDAPITVMVNETAAEITRAALDTVQLLQSGGRFQHSSKEKIRGWLPRYRLMAAVHEPVMIAALTNAIAHIPPDGVKETAPLLAALLDILRAGQDAVLQLARIRPEVWQRTADQLMELL